MPYRTFAKRQLSNLRQLKQRGFGLLEVILSLAVIGILSYLVFTIFGGASTTASIKRETDNMAFVASRIPRIFASQGNYAGITTATMITAKAFPDSMAPSGATVVSNSFKGNVTVAPANILGTNDGFAITSAGIPQDACGEIASTSANAFTQIAINGTVVRSLTNPNVQVSATAAACNDATNNTIIFTGK